MPRRTTIGKIDLIGGDEDEIPLSKSRNGKFSKDSSNPKSGGTNDLAIGGESNNDPFALFFGPNTPRNSAKRSSIIAPE